ncbi:MAG: biotin--[Erysipelotrichaceae bacterium]|nr:biotin--[acetyl-CoA-carboxylase] ligase [Erysipelotrichaceae bacterium]
MKELYFSELDSTNTYLKEHYEELEDMCFVRADYQSAGKGRNSRKWTADRNSNLTFSLLIKNEEVIRRYKALSVLSAYSVLEVLKDYGINDLMIKWPNDVYVSVNKICGILLESVVRERIECLIIGIGINVNQVEFNDSYFTKPTSMKLCLNKYIDLNELKDRIYKQLSENIEALLLEHDFYEEIRAFDYLKDKKAEAYLDGNKEEVEIIGIANDYSLEVKTKDGIRKIESGEITFHQGVYQ